MYRCLYFAALKTHLDLIILSGSMLNIRLMHYLHRNHLLPKKQSTLNREVLRYPPQSKAQRGGGPVRQTTDLDALQKITALESQLLKLQAQIAMIVTAAPASGMHSLYLYFSKNTQTHGA